MSVRLPFVDRVDGHTREVFAGTVVAFGTKVAGVGLTFVFNVLIARMFGPAGAGNYFLAATVTLVATVVARAGLDNTLLRFIASANADRDWGRARGVYARGMSLALGTSVLAALAMYVTAPLLAGGLFSKAELTPMLRLMAFAVVPTSILMLHSEAIKALKRIMASLVVYGVGLPAVGIVALLVLPGTGGELDAAWAHTLGAALTALLGLGLWKRYTRGFDGPVRPIALTTLVNSSFPLFLVATMTLVMAWTGTVLLGVWGTSAEVGIFTAAARTALLTSLILVAANSVAAPKFAELFHRGDMSALGSVARRTAGLVTALASPIFLAFVLMPEFFMGLFGPDFRAGGPVLLVLALGQFANVMSGSVAYVLMMCGRERLLRNNMAVSALFNVVLNLVLIPVWGMMGAAVATAISITTLNFGAAYLVWSRLGIQTIPFLPSSAATAGLTSPRG